MAMISRFLLSAASGRSARVWNAVSSQLASTRRIAAGVGGDEEENESVLRECGSRGLEIIESFSPLTGDRALEATHLLLKASKLKDAKIWHALGCLYYLYSDEMERMELTASDSKSARRSVLAEVKLMRKKAMAERRTRSMKLDVNHEDNSGIVTHTKVQDLPPRVSNADAFAWFSAAAEAGHTMSMFMLANMAMEESGETAFNFSFAEHWYTGAASGEPPVPDAYFQLARLYHEEGPKRDEEKSLRLYRRAADAGSSAALFFLGFAMIHGSPDLPIERDPKRGAAMLEAAALRRHPEALYTLGYLEAGILPNKERYMELLNRGSDEGSADAQFALGDIYRRGLNGIEVQPYRAFELYRRAAEGGHAEAAFCAGAMHYHGIGCEKDLTKAFELYQVAAERGHVAAWREVASMHLLGEGVEQCEATARSILKVMGPIIEELEKAK